MEVLTYTAAMFAGFAAVAAILWSIGPKDDASEAEQADNQW